jgi:hypothetical protein
MTDIKDARTLTPRGALKRVAVGIQLGIRCAGSRLVGPSSLLAEEFCFLHHSNFRCRKPRRKPVELASAVSRAIQTIHSNCAR